MRGEETATRQTVRWAISVVLATVFIVAASAKIRDFDDFQITLMRSQLLGNGYTTLVSTLIVGLEVAIAFGLLVPPLRRLALSMVGGLCCLFISYSAWRWAQHIPVPCSCFGTLFSMTPPQAIGLNTALLGLATWLFHLENAPIQQAQILRSGAGFAEGGASIQV